MSQVRSATTPEDLRRCHAVASQLRPHLDVDAFVAQVQRQGKEGYRVAFLEADGSVVAYAGFRIVHMLYSGRILYLDDLVTDAARRGQGHGKAMLTWLVAEAKREQCDSFELDSGVARVGAHRFYLENGMHIASYHFRMDLKKPAPSVLGTPAGR